jgi:hypothetical protein
MHQIMAWATQIMKYTRSSKHAPKTDLVRMLYREADDTGITLV